MPLRDVVTIVRTGQRTGQTRARPRAPTVRTAPPHLAGRQRRVHLGRLPVQPDELRAAPQAPGRRRALQPPVVATPCPLALAAPVAIVSRALPGGQAGRGRQGRGRLGASGRRRGAPLRQDRHVDQGTPDRGRGVVRGRRRPRCRRDPAPGRLPRPCLAPCTGRRRREDRPCAGTRAPALHGRRGAARPRLQRRTSTGGGSRWVSIGDCCPVLCLRGRTACTVAPSSTARSLCSSLFDGDHAVSIVLDELIRCKVISLTVQLNDRERWERRRHRCGRLALTAARRRGQGLRRLVPGPPDQDDGPTRPRPG